MADPQRQLYKGGGRALVIGIDVGITFSSVSYSILEPGKIPEVHNVTLYKGQENLQASPKVPTVIFYNSGGEVVARGAEPDDEEVDEDHVKIERFKILLRPEPSKLATSDLSPCELPEGVTITDVLGEFLRYLKECVRDYIKEREIDGSAIWEAASPTAHYIFTYPNGWGEHQQDQMRSSAIKGGLIPDNPKGKARMTFLSEGEANLHWFVDAGIVSSSLEVGSHIIICDAGDEIIDVSSFRITTLQPMAVTKASNSDSRAAGAVFVTNNFRHAMTDKLEGSKWASDEYIAFMTTVFDTKLKCLFLDKDKAVRLKFGMRDDTDDEYDIRHGFITLPGSLIASFFEKSCRETVDAIEKQLTSNSEEHLFLVGSLSVSPYLFNEIKERLRDKISDVCRSDITTGIGISHGAVTCHLGRLQNSDTRMAKYTFGFSVAWRYDPSDEYHKARERDVYTDATDGFMYIRGGFECLIRKGDCAWPDRTYITAVRRTYASLQDVCCVVQLERYSGLSTNPTFKDMDDSSLFRTVGTFKIEIPKAALVKKQEEIGDWEHWELRFMFILKLGVTGFQPYAQWTEEGLTMTQRAPSVWEV